MRSNKEILDPHISNCMSEMYILEAMKEAQIEVLNEVDRKCTEHGMWSYCDKMMIQKLKEELK
jgi:hypothetical protein